MTDSQKPISADYSPLYTSPNRHSYSVALRLRTARRRPCVWKSPSKTKAPAAPRDCRSVRVRGGVQASHWPPPWSFSSPDGLTRPTARVCAQSTKTPVSPLSARLLNHRNYFQRQPEHVEDEFMHHNRKNEIMSIQLVPINDTLGHLTDVP